MGREGNEVRKGVVEEEDVGGGAAEEEEVVVAAAEDWDKRDLKGKLPESPAIALSCGGGSGGREFGDSFLINF